MKPVSVFAMILAFALGAVALPSRLGGAGTEAPAAAPSSSTAAQPNCRAPVQAAMPAPALVVTVSADREAVPVGAPVTFTLTVSNPTDAPVTLPMGEPLADFRVTAASGAEVWRWSHGKFFRAILFFCTFGPGETVTFSEQWDQRNIQGQQVPAGTYLVTGELGTVQPRLTSPAQPFTIGEPPPGER